MNKKVLVRQLEKRDIPEAGQMKIPGSCMMLCTHGDMQLIVNGSVLCMEKGSAAFIAFDMAIVVRKVSTDFRAKSVFCDFDTTQNIFYRIGNSGFWEIIYGRPVFTPSREEYKQLERWLDLMTWTAANVSAELGRRCLADSTADMLAVIAERMAKLGRSENVMPKKNRAWTLTNDFVGLLERHCPSHHDVAYFARKLNITPNYLNIIAKRNLGVSAKTQILIKIIEAARVLLATTDLNVKQIAEILNFDDPSYLARIFRKRTGLTPLQYRNSLTSEEP